MAKKAKRPASKKAGHKSLKDKLGIPEVIPTDPKIQINEKGREKMFKVLRKSDHADLLKIFEVYDKSDKAGKEKILTYYERHGTSFINAIFRGDINDAIHHATDEMAKVLRKI